MEIGEVIFSITMIILTTEGEWSDPIYLKIIDGNIPCSYNDDACTKKYDKYYVIWINIDELWQRDKCERDPIFHEFMHVKHWGKDIHNNCSLN